LIFFADEEDSGTFGSRWLVKHRPEIFKGFTEAISEVGGFSITITGNNRLYLIEAAQKGIQWMRLTTKGTAGHGSFINPDNSVTKLSEVISRIGNFEWPEVLTKTNHLFFKKIAELTGEIYDQKNLRPLLKHLGKASKMIGATLSNTANPTMLEAGYKANVIPQSASAVIDGRFLPGHEKELMQTIKSLAGDDVEIEMITEGIALEAEFAGALVDAMSSALRSQDQDGIPVPYLMSGGTDNTALSDLGIIGFGFTPLRLPEDLDFFSLFHGVDERVPTDGLKFGVRVLQEFLENV
jgi:acetylornithine deacetylase/succinyl-diaminopimelate desuccinylase-like protein